MASSFLLLLGILVFFHFIADYPLQGPFLSVAKNHREPIPNYPWWHAMTAHAFIQAGFVFLATGYWFLFVAEFVIHFWTDHRKCSGEITINQDQAIHLGCKVAWAAIVVVLS